MSSVVTRFAPSPTGYLHVGSARTALFNWLFAKHFGGTCLLRIEDTDKERSTQDAVDAIFSSLAWLGLDFDGEPVFQSKRLTRHQEVAHKLLNEGKAYYCYCTPEELAHMRERARSGGRPVSYDGRWRDKDPKDAPKDIAPTVRLKSPQSGTVLLHDEVQGDVQIDASHIDDMILLRSDGSPTYMLSVVVDDHDMNVTHVIRGDDHLVNALRQRVIYDACGWNAPIFAHIPLIHGADGAKLSKRHGALGAHEYKDMGYVREAMQNHLLRLGWGHKDEEIIPLEKAIELFTLQGVGRAPARFDTAKLLSFNGHYLKTLSTDTLFDRMLPFFSDEDQTQAQIYKNRLLKGLPGIVQRSKTLIDAVEMASIYLHAPNMIEEKAKHSLKGDTHALLTHVLKWLRQQKDWEEGALEESLRTLSLNLDTKMGILATLLRVGLTGRSISPSVFDMLTALGRDASIERLEHLPHLLDAMQGQ